MRKQSGIIALIAVVLMVIGGSFMLSMTLLSTTTTRSATDRLLAKQAYYIAEAGLERGKFGLLSTTVSVDPLTQRYDCTSLTFTAESYGEGEFTVTGTDHDTSTTLSAGITAVATIIPVASIAGLAETGKVKVNSEYIDYVGTSTSPGVCGTAPCLINGIRGVDGTTAAAHISTSGVVQSACLITSTGGVPDLTTPIAQRTVSQLLEKPPAISDVLWAVGDDSGTDEYIAEGDGTTWTLEGPSGGINGDEIFSISMASETFGFAVGDNDAGTPFMVTYNGTSWTQHTNTLPNQELFSVFCLDSSNCFAVGDNIGGTAFAARWNGVSWSQMATGALPGRDLNDIHCLSTSFCIAVGDRQGGSGLVARWNGISWSRMTFFDNRNLEAIFCIATNDCWTGGANGKVYHYNGASWSGIIDDVGPQVTDIVCVATNDCWSSGTNRSGFDRYNGVSWNPGAGTGSLPNVSYGGIDCISSTDCWAVGNNSGGAVTVHWDGASWSRVLAPGLPNRDLVDVDFVTDGSGTFTIRTAPWGEDFY